MSVESKETTIRPIHPLWFIPISLVAGLVTSGPLAGATLCRCGYRRLGWGLGAGLMPIGAALLLLCGLWGTQWYWVALILSLIHLVCGSALFLIVRRPYKQFQVSHPPASQRGSYRNTIAGMVGGALIGVLIGTVLSIPYELLSGRLFSTVLPVSFNDTMDIFKVLAGAVFLALLGIIAGGLLGRFRPGITAGQAFLYSIFLVWVHQSWMLCFDAVIAAPAFQAHSATLNGWQSFIFPFVPLELFIGFWWTVFLLFFVISSPSLSGKLMRSGLVFAMNLAVAVTVSVSFGYVTDLLLDLGKHFERTAQTSKALWCYELSLKKEPKEQIGSYLQYRIALLNHSLGQEKEARQGFRRVVAKYNRNEYLVKKANQFLDSMERRQEGKRVVLPGVENSTEYKGGYCVPNSLALVMRYWGLEMPARIIGSRITSLGGGTLVVDQRWFAEQQGWRHDFLPMASVEDIKRCIDAGFPILVYVPAHVLAIVGYDEVLETFITYDVATVDIWEEYVQKDFIKSWKRQAATLVLSYPPEKEEMIPDDIRRRLEGLSDNYLQFQLHYLDRPKDSISIAHLSKAAGANGTFFFAVTALYRDFPSLRASLDTQYDANQIAESIKEYFWNDFDEGINIAGQRHDERGALPDRSLAAAVSYLICNGRFDLAEALISRINNQGRVSKEMLADIGLMDLSIGEFSRGLDLIRNADIKSTSFYAGLAELKRGNSQAAIQALVKTIERRA